ncbi:MAG: hypothetical protein AABX83_02620 [Nanoarchaeota archaeon]
MEERVRKITSLYYSNPKVQEAILKFSISREVVPRYLESFGKRPDTLQYLSDIHNLVKKGATSFHASEEIWHDPLKINSDMTLEELNNIRKGWDLLIDIDSKYLDLAKVLARLIIEALESHGIKNYGVKFSGSKGWHIIVSWSAFPEELNGMNARYMFPEWPRAICQYLMNYVRKDYNKKTAEIMGNVEKIKQNTKLPEEEFLKSPCPECGRPAKRGILVTLKCPECKFEIKRKDVKSTKRKLTCPQNSCAGVLELIDQEDYYQCEICKGISSINKRELSDKHKTTFTKDASSYNFEAEILGEVFGASDLVLVAPRHLIRAPYSLHEKTSLASVVINKNEIENFNPPKDADPLRVAIKDFIPLNTKNEALRLLIEAIKWKKSTEIEEENSLKKKYEYKELDIKGVSEDIFPKAIKLLLKGLKDGRKRGLFVLLTFLKSLNFPPEYINNKIREWNKLNQPPLKEGYVKSQIDWHLKQRKKILPPNYSNSGFYKDLGLIEEMPKAKNPLAEVIYIIKKQK